MPDVFASDVMNWTQRVLPATAGWQTVVYGGGQFVALASSSTIGATSPDGITWTQRTIPSGLWISVAYGAGTYVGVATNSTISAYSTNGITWTQRGLPGNSTWKAVAYGAGLFVAVASGTTGSATSPDGITWTARTAPNITWYGVAYGNGVFVAVAGGSIAATSPDGITWTTTTMPGALYSTITFGGGLFLAVASTTGTAVTSPDGINWTTVALPTATTWQGTAYGGGLLAAVAGSSTVAATSPDGITWTQRTLPGSTTWRAMAYGAGVFVALANSSAVAASGSMGLELATATESTGALVYRPSGADTVTADDNDLRRYSSADTASGVDSAGSVVVAVPKTGAAETGHVGVESVGAIKLGFLGADTASGTDAPTNRRIQTAPETGTATDVLATRRVPGTETVTGVDALPQRSGSDSVAGAETVSTRRLQSADSAKGADSSPKDDTISVVETEQVALPGQFTQIPDPKVWQNGDAINAGVLDKEWRDAITWLLRETSPVFEAYNADGAALVSGAAIPLTTESQYQGNLSHVAGETRVYVWETGWYMALVQIGADISGAVGTTFVALLSVNGAVMATSDVSTVASAVSLSTAFQVPVYLSRGHFVEIALGGTWTGTALGGSDASTYPTLSLSWRNN